MFKRNNDIVLFVSCHTGQLECDDSGFPKTEIGDEVKPSSSSSAGSSGQTVIMSISIYHDHYYWRCLKNFDYVIKFYLIYAVLTGQAEGGNAQSGSDSMEPSKTTTQVPVAQVCVKA